MKELNGKMEDFLLKFAADIDKMTENDFQKLVRRGTRQALALIQLIELLMIN